MLTTRVYSYDGILPSKICSRLINNCIYGKRSLYCYLDWWEDPAVYAGKGGSFCFAHDSGKTVGVCFINCDKTFLLTECGYTKPQLRNVDAMITMYIRPQYRGRGIARKLVCRAEEEYRFSFDIETPVLFACGPSIPIAKRYTNNSRIKEGWSW